MRCYIHPDDWLKSEIDLPAEEAHHVAQVLRAKPGDSVDVFNGCGGFGTAVVETAGKRGTTLTLGDRRQAPPPPVSVTLVQGLPREQKMDLIIQKAVELGVSAIVPVLTEHAVVRLDGERSAGRKARWDRIALGAAKQSGNPWLPRIDAPIALADFLASRPAYDLFLLGALAGQPRPIRDVLRGATPRTAAAAIGPEGDFSPAELQALLHAGAVPVTFGPIVLRAETAAIYVLTCLQYEYLSSR